MVENELLSVKQLSVKLQNKVILLDTHLTLNFGDILGLVGPSGCGKTTLLNTIAGFNSPSTGELNIKRNNSSSTHLIVEEDVLTITPFKHVVPEHRNIGMIFQDYALFPHLSVEKNICFGINKLPKSEQKFRMTDLLNLLKLTGLEARFPHQLSGGQQQRVAIARALAPQPTLLLLDEPFSNIDARLRNELMLEMRQILKQLKMSAIFVTHNKDEVFTFADKIAVMHQGSILQIGRPADVCHSPNSWQVADFLQLGSWIPVKAINGQFQSAVGELPSTEDLFLKENMITYKGGPQKLQLLLKSQAIVYCEDGFEKNNVKVDNISITEHGFHYLLSSIDKDLSLSFEQLSFYSNCLFALGQKIAIKIKSHNYQVFNSYDDILG
ncbi:MULTISPECIES: ABC transporter ATP-binding protein [unclassified Colwellia]|uniref:ABC transporter ATP-binding protein n=1 Tax=unclassified Colwellia TaxID=196834 RepID=UPI0015F39CE1|nr:MULTISPECIES: ABC transporter ATP-binding protein [unclassified Colwellia]MBA6231707.1 ABC transporter ATP-binding protein [Colwellia sp. MB02u-7]MBA6235571.1 ABC transporter ATP-binding protein [Colwellia sp. MB02u-11]MBA6254916.1 ABC transporter ATP-binding protein [Colwellia sp. MB3u-28]MBA6259698.1 ABC transporter ATP-binding protein [Colwellia sp. MB3u-41]MBA6300295.1 ABC transporter ATP-binding protein [Colwellia sp. MB3u-22]